MKFNDSLTGSFHFRRKEASDACGYPDSPTRLLREVPQAPLEHRFSICGCAFLQTLLTTTGSPLAVVFFFLLRFGLLHQAAKNAFDEMGVKKLPKVKELQTEYAKLLEEKKKTYAEYGVPVRKCGSF